MIDRLLKRMIDKNKILAAILGVMLLVPVAVPARAQLSNLHFGGYSISSVRPQSFSSVSGSVKVTVTNDASSFVMKNISGKVYRQGTPLVQGHADDIFVPRGLSEIAVKGEASLCEGVGIMSILSCLFGFDINEYTADVSMTIVDNQGHTRHFSEKGMSVAAVLNNLRARKSSSPR